jgi:hypothetical protein
MSPACADAGVHPSYPAVFFRPNDGISVSEGPESRTLAISPNLPASMSRNGGEW